MTSEACPTAAQRAQWLNGVAHAVAAKERHGKSERMTPLDLQVALVLVRCYVNRSDGNAWPAQDRLASDVGVTSRAVWDSLKRLTVAGFITSERRGPHDSNVIRLSLHRARADPRLAHSDTNRGSGPTRRDSGLAADRAEHIVPRMTGQTRATVPARSEPPSIPDPNHDSDDSIGRTHLNDSSDSSRPSAARDGCFGDDSSEVMKALGIWNEFCRRIHRSSLHKLTPEHETRLRYVLFTHHLRGWEIIVEQFEARYRRACILRRKPRPPDIAICLREAESLLDRADSPGNYPTIDGDELIW